MVYRIVIYRKGQVLDGDRITTTSINSRYD